MELSNFQNLVSYFKNAFNMLTEHGEFLIVTANPSIYTPGKDWFSLSANPNNKCYSGNQVQVFVKDSKIVFNDYYWEQSDLLLALSIAGFTNFVVRQPTGDFSDPFPWKEELVSSTNLIISAYKK